MLTIFISRWCIRKTLFPKLIVMIVGCVPSLHSATRWWFSFSSICSFLLAPDTNWVSMFVEWHRSTNFWCMSIEETYWISSETFFTFFYVWFAHKTPASVALISIYCPSYRIVIVMSMLLVPYPYTLTFPTYEPRTPPHRRAIVQHKQHLAARLALDGGQVVLIFYHHSSGPESAMPDHANARAMTVSSCTPSGAP